MRQKVKYIDWTDDKGNMGTSFVIMLEAESISEAFKEYEEIKFSNTFEPTKRTRPTLGQLIGEPKEKRDQLAEVDREAALSDRDSDFCT